jgi:serine O-acetyltransferase
MGALDDLRLDLARFRTEGRGTTAWDRLRIVLTTEQVWVIVTYRLTRWAMRECRIPVVRTVLSVALRLHLHVLRALLHIWLDPHAQIGGGLYINHFGTIWVNPGVVIGRFCNLRHGVTIGLGGSGEGRGVPTLGDRVNIGPYAVIVGRIRIGEDVGIGANSLVISDLPDRAVAIGVPARIISRLGGGIPENPTVPRSEARPPASVCEAREEIARAPEV